MSEENENKITQEEEKTKKELKAEKKEEKKCQKKIEELDEEIKALNDKVKDYQSKFELAEKDKDEWKNKYYEAYANLSNTRRQIEKEGEDFKKYANKSLLTEFIPVLDSFDMAFKTEPKDPAIKNYLVGFKMIHSKLLEFLNKMNVEVISPNIGDEYDPHKMEALSTVEGDEDNKVAEVYYKGYKLHDSLLRASSVVITKKKESSSNEKEGDLNKEAPKQDESNKDESNN